MRITTVAMGAVFVGPPLNRSEEYSRLANEHVDAAIAAVGSLLPYHVLLRPLVRRLSPLVRTMRRLEREFCQLISRHQEEQDSKRQDFLNGWLRHEMPRSERKLEPLDVSRAILTSCLDGNLSSSQVLTQALVDLAVHPGYMDELRCEMEDAADKAEAQKLSQAQRLALLVRLDSFIQESQRLNPITLGNSSSREIHAHGLTRSSWLLAPHKVHNHPVRRNRPRAGHQHAGSRRVAEPRPDDLGRRRRRVPRLPFRREGCHAPVFVFRGAA